MKLIDLEDIYERYPRKRDAAWDKDDNATMYCPHCGKKMTLLPKKNWKRRTDYVESYDDDFWPSGSTVTCTVPTFKCEADNIIYVDDHDMRECAYDENWYFPKGYKATITEKQRSYIENAFSHSTYITSIELASKFLSEVIPLKKANDDELAKRKNIQKALYEQYVFSTDYRYGGKADLFMQVKSNTDEWLSEDRDYYKWPEGFLPKFTLDWDMLKVDFTYSYNNRYDENDSDMALNQSSELSSYVDECVRKRNWIQKIVDETYYQEDK